MLQAYFHKAAVLFLSSECQRAILVTRLLEDKAQFEDERKKVYELNSKLNELCKGQETVMEQVMFFKIDY